MQTRWVARIDALEVFNDLFPAVVSTFEMIDVGQSRNNVRGDSPELYFKRSVSFPFID